jgi:hypothetical protein
MSISLFRRHTARRLAETALLGDPLPSPELSLPEALAAADRAAAGAAGRLQAERAFMQALPSVAAHGASFGETVPQAYPRGGHPYPQESARQSGPQQQAPGPRPSFAARPGTGPFPVAPRPLPAAPPRRGPQPTQEWRPDFAESSRHARLYVPRSPIRPLSPATPMFILFRNPRARRQALTAAQARVEQVSYPVIDIRDHNGQRERYAALMRYYDTVTGTRSPYGNPANWPAPSAPEVPQRGRAITAGGQS